MTITAMKQALEALTRIWEDGLESFPESAHDAAINALRAAIAEAEKQDLDEIGWLRKDGGYFAQPAAQQDLVLAEREAVCRIVTGLCISDNNAEEINRAIRARGQT